MARLGDGAAGTSVFFGWSSFELALAESVVRKAFELAGYDVRVLSEPNPVNRKVYAELGVDEIQSFQCYCPREDHAEAARVLDSVTDFQAFVSYEFEGVAVGKYVASTLMRRTRQGSIDVRSPELRDRLTVGLATSISAVRGALRMIDELDPKVVVMVDRGYTPYGEVFDVCINTGISVITWNVAHRDNTIMLKRYHDSNRAEHPSSLSEGSWQRLLDLPWEDGQGSSLRDKLQAELQDAYNGGEWYGEVGTQFGKRAWKKAELIKRLGLDDSRPLAVIYSHIFWDATFFWGVDLFRDYEDWFVQTVKAACANPELNWLIKVHPANLVKNRRDGVDSEPSEIIALREQIGPLPDHVKLLEADADLTTLSLLGIADYCLTVRGTVGIEAALLGNTVLTAGTGRYDNHGFTRDFDSAEDYLEALAKLQDIEFCDDTVQQRAVRFGYGIFLCRPVRLRAISVRYLQDETATIDVSLNVATGEELASSPDVTGIADWLRDGGDDFLSCHDSKADMPMQGA